jgi:heterodisulfide reductase subunit C
VYPTTHATVTDQTFLAEVMAQTPGGEKLKTCLQCGTCGGSCPSAPEMDHSPRTLFALIASGERAVVLKSNGPWYCVSCYYCMVRCPQDIPVTDVMYTLRRMSASGRTHRDGEVADFSRTFIDLVERYGRSFELGLAARYHLTHSPFEKISQGPMALGMVLKDRLSFRPKRIRNLAAFKTILAKAKAVEAKLIAASRGEGN